MVVACGNVMIVFAYSLSGRDHEEREPNPVLSLDSANISRASTMLGIDNNYHGIARRSA